MHVVDSRAMYLQSVRSPGFGGALGAKFKRSYQSDPEDDVFSQERSDESRYLSDSFCIGSDELDEPGLLSSLGSRLKEWFIFPSFCFGPSSFKAIQMEKYGT